MRTSRRLVYQEIDPPLNLQLWVPLGSRGITRLTVSIARLRRPRDLPAAPISQIRDMSRARRADSGFHRRVWLLARSHALKKIPHVVDRPVLITLRLHHRIHSFRNALMEYAKSVPVELQRRIRSAELQPAVVDGRAHHPLVHHIESRITHRRLHCVRAIPLFE